MISEINTNKITFVKNRLFGTFTLEYKGEIFNISSFYEDFSMRCDFYIPDKLQQDHHAVQEIVDFMTEAFCEVVESSERAGLPINKYLESMK